jgi:Fic family protein
LPKPHKKPAELLEMLRSFQYRGFVAVRDCMPAFFELLHEEPEPAVRIVLGHFVFVYIHPYMDGNGRIGRFLMNVMLAAGGYSWTVIPVERRNEYMGAL